MENTEKQTLNREQLKIFNSTSYRRKIKRMVELAKTLRGMTKIPKGSLPKLKKNATQREREVNAANDNYRLNIQTLHYFAESMHGSHDRREKTVTESTPPEPAPQGN